MFLDSKLRKTIVGSVVPSVGRIAVQWRSVTLLVDFDCLKAKELLHNHGCRFSGESLGPQAPCPTISLPSLRRDRPLHAPRDKVAITQRCSPGNAFKGCSLQGVAYYYVQRGNVADRGRSIHLPYRTTVQHYRTARTERESGRFEHGQCSVELCLPLRGWSTP